jgi:hypothetical protein
LKEPYILNCKVVRKAVTNKAWKKKGKPKDSTHKNGISLEILKNNTKISLTDSPLLCKTAGK